MTSMLGSAAFSAIASSFLTSSPVARSAARRAALAAEPAAEVEHVDQHLEVGRAVARDQVRDQLHAGGLHEVEHAGAVALAGLDQAHVLERLDGLAQRRAVDPQLLGQLALGRELVARRRTRRAGSARAAAGRFPLQLVVFRQV